MHLLEWFTESKPKLFPRNYLFHLGTLLFGKEVFDNQLFLLRNIIPKGSNSSLCGCLFLSLITAAFFFFFQFQVAAVLIKTVEYQNFDICQSVFHPKILLISEESFRFEFEGFFI